MGIRCQVNKEQNTLMKDKIKWESRCEVNKDLNTRGNDEIRWESDVRKTRT